MLITKEIVTKWRPNNKNNLVNFGYLFTKMGDKILIKIEDLSLGSGIVIEFQCDYCGKTFPRTYENYNRKLKKSIIKKDCCINCKHSKVIESLIETYGVTSVRQIPGVNEKIKATNIDRYGYEIPSNCKAIKDKIETTNLLRYGSKYGLSNPIIRDKINTTNLKRYGFKSPTQNPIIRENTRLTLQKRYGVDFIGSIPGVIEKRAKTFSLNGTVKTSQQQLTVYNILLENNYDVKLNYAVSRCVLDIALITINDIKINIEYDGQYWHDKNNDRKRDEFLKSQGWKILRIKSGRKIPSLEQLKESLDKLINTKQNFTSIVLDDWIL